MHYKNGREAKNGDKVVLMTAIGYSNESVVVGILYNAQAGNDYCNGRIAPISPSDPMPNLKECLHLDDVLKVLSLEDVPDSTKEIGDRRVFYIDVGDLPKEKVEQYIKDLTEKYRKKDNE